MSVQPLPAICVCHRVERGRFFVKLVQTQTSLFCNYRAALPKNVDACFAIRVMEFWYCAIEKSVAQKTKASSDLILTRPDSRRGSAFFLRCCFFARGAFAAGFLAATFFAKGFFVAGFLLAAVLATGFLPDDFTGALAFGLALVLATGFLATIFFAGLTGVALTCFFTAGLAAGFLPVALAAGFAALTAGLATGLVALAGLLGLAGAAFLAAAGVGLDLAGSDLAALVGLLGATACFTSLTCFSTALPADLSACLVAFIASEALSFTSSAMFSAILLAAFTIGSAFATTTFLALATFCLASSATRRASFVTRSASRWCAF